MNTNKRVHGQFAVTIASVRYVSEYEIFKLYLDSLRPRLSLDVGWYARKVESGIIYLKWCKHGHKPGRKYLNSLSKDGWLLV